MGNPEFSPIKKHDFKRFNLGPAKCPRCPLCLELMVKKWIPQRQLFAFTCDTQGSCRIAIRVDDPFVGLWEGKTIPCVNPRCPGSPDNPMRYFATSTGFMKAFCPKCKATIDNREPDREKEKFYTPETPGSLQ